MKILRRIWENDVLVGWIIFVLAFLPRVIPASGIFLNVDAAGHWITRTKTFLLGILSGNTLLLAPTGHPGVTLMWLTSAAEFFLQKTNAYTLWADPLVGYLAVLNIPLYIATSALAAAVWMIGRRVLPRALAAILAVLLALNPLYVVFSRHLQLDALLTGFVSVGILAWWGALEKRSRRWAIITGIFFALAALTRLNAAIAFVFAGVSWMAMGAWKDWRLLRHMLLAAAITTVIVWPIVVPHPVVTLLSLTWGVNLGLTSHELINPELVPDWIRPLYFPIFLLTRITTFELGLLVIGVWALVRTARRSEARVIWYLLGWTGMVIVGLFLTKKQIDRYALPAVFGLLAVAAYGTHAVVWPLIRTRRWAGIVLAGLALWQIGAVTKLQPYFQTYRNALGEVLVQTPVTASPALWPDWGEGVREAMNRLHDQTGRWPSTSSWFPAVACVYGRDRSPDIFPFAPRQSLGCDTTQFFFSTRAQEAEYILISRDQRQQAFYPAPQIAELGWTTEFIVELNGHPWVWVYRNRGDLPPFPK